MIGTLQAQAPRPNSDSPEKFVKQYLELEDHEGQAARRIAANLRWASSEKTHAALRKGLEQPSTRFGAIALTAQLRHPQAWDLLSSIIDSQEHKAAIDALWLCDDPGIERKLIDKWCKLGSSDLADEYLTSCLYRRQLSAESLDSLARFAFPVAARGRRAAPDPTAKQVAAKAVLCAQFSLPPDFPEDAIIRRSESLREIARERSKKMQGSGTPVRLNGGVAWGANREYKSGEQVLIALPETVQAASHEVTYWFLPLSKDNCAVGYESTQGTWSVTMTGGEGRIVTGSHEEHITSAKPDQWSEVRFKVKCLDVPGQIEKDRRVTIYVNEKQVITEYQFNGTLHGLTFRGPVVVGGCSFSLIDA